MTTHPITTERRVNRSSYKSEALRLQLEACQARGGLDAMVLADEDGLCVAATGNLAMCEELAVRSAFVGRRTRQFRGVMLAAGNAWEVDLRRVEFAGMELYVSAVGGDEAHRAAQVTHSASGVERILAS